MAVLHRVRLPQVPPTLLLSALSLDFTPPPPRLQGGWVHKEAISWEIFVFQFGAEISPTKLFCAIRGTSCSLGLLGGASASFSMESQPGPCSSFFISDELVLFKTWSLQSFT